MPMRVGIFGGSFDPIHVAHLIHAEACFEAAVLDRLLFIPAPRPPHKQNGTCASFNHRAEMLRLAIADRADWEVNLCEADRSGPSYTVDTLRLLQQRETGSDFFLIVGSDSVRDLGTWREPQNIAKLATLLIVQRPGTETVAPPEYFRFTVVPTPLLDVSSTNLRQRVLEGKSLRYYVPESVRKYILKHHLYGSEPS